MPAISDPDSGAPIGYLPRWSYRRGELVDVHVSCTEPWQADIVHMHYGDPRPDGPGLLETAVTSVTSMRKPCTAPTFPGSMAWAPVAGLLPRVALVSWVRPTHLTGWCGQVVFSAQRRDGRTIWGLSISPDGHWQILSNQASAALGSVAVGNWHLIQLIADTSVGVARLRILTDGRPVGTRDAEVPFHPYELACLAIGGGLSNDSAQADVASGATFDGVIAQPSLIDPLLTERAIDALASGTRIAGPGTFASWSFPAGTQPESAGPAPAGPVQLRNSPAAAMPGPHGVLDALHCHSDDMTDAEWPIGTRVAVPDNARSGIYAVRLHSNSGTDRIPFIVRPQARSDAQVLLVLPTMTYLAYANEIQPAPENYLADYADQARPSPLDRWLARHPEYGFSTYDCHADGSGVNYSSLRRPIPNIRPDYLHWFSGEPRHLGADLFISDWLDRTGIPYDVICDHDLDDQGYELLEPYRVILTGSHPEYCTRAMLDALERHLDRDGRLMYLGGNGFYWVTSTSPREPTTIEVRRGQKGYPWKSAPNEDIQSFDGHRGGFWADNGRAPHNLVGITYIAMGHENPAPGYTLNDQLPSADKWIIDGLERVASFGTTGRLMGGAAGHEIDCVDADCAEDVTVVASSSGHAQSLQLAAHRRAANSGVNPILPHSDVVLYRRSSGGTVFSTGSICWCGSLAELGGDRSVQHLTQSVLRRFIEKSTGK